MRAALAEAGAAQSAGEVPVGAVVVIDGKVAGAGPTVARRSRSNRACGNRRVGAAAAARDNHRLTAATAYVTLEPCLMCMAAFARRASHASCRRLRTRRARPGPR